MYATLALQAGVHPKAVSDILGHANVAITMDTCTHAIPTMQKNADLMETIVFADRGTWRASTNAVSRW